MKIYLVRHGKPDIDLRGWTNTAGYAKLLRKYNRSGIIKNEQHSNKVASLIGSTAKCFSSDSPRAVDTANEVLSGQNLISDKLFREIELPVIRMPIIANYFIWRSLYRFFWLISLNKKESLYKSKKKISKAALKLSSEAEKNDVVLFGHGMMNSLLALELKLKGWKCHVPLVNNYWNVIILEE